MNTEASKINTLGRSMFIFYVILTLWVNVTHFYYNVSGESSSANEIVSYLILMNIHKVWSHDR